MAQRPAIAKVWTFASDSSSKTHETLQYVDGSLSCSCPGWTRRVDARGQRSCKHTRLVDQGYADETALKVIEYAKLGPVSYKIALVGGRLTAPQKFEKPSRKMSLTDEEV